MPKISTTISTDGTIIKKQFDKVPYKPSKDKTEKYGWNAFKPLAWNAFRNKHGINAFVDVKTEYQSWFENTNDTVVFILNLSKINVFQFMQEMPHLMYDEFHFIQLSKNQAIIRLWWD